MARKTGLPDRRLKYDQERLQKFTLLAASREMTVREAAEAMGCPSKYMDKRVRAHRRANGEA